MLHSWGEQSTSETKKDVEILNQQRNGKQTVEQQNMNFLESCPKLDGAQTARIFHSDNTELRPAKRKPKESTEAQFMNNFAFASLRMKIHGKWFIKYSTEDNKVNVLKDASTICAPFDFLRLFHQIDHRRCYMQDVDIG